MSQPPLGPPPPGQGDPPWGQPGRPGHSGGWEQQPDRPPAQPPGHAPGWRPPQQPGHAPPPTQVGGYAPPGQPPHYGAPGVPAWGPPGAPGWPGGPQGAGPAGGRSSSTGLLIAGIVGLAVLAVVATVLALTLNGGDDRATASAPSTVAAPSTPSAPPPLPPALPPAAPAQPAGEELAGFLDTLPEGFTDCDEAAPADDGDLLSAGCGPATDPPGPSAARFYRYPDVATLDEVFTDDVTGSGLTEFPDDEDCSTGLGYGGWNVDGVVGGMYGCAVLDDGTVSIAWTDDEFLTEGIVVAPGTTQADVAELYDWWLQNSAYRG